MAFAATVLVLLFLAPMAFADTVTFYSNAKCTGVTGSCANIGARVCCVGQGKGLGFTLTTGGAYPQGFTGGGCTKQVCTFGGNCCTGSTAWTGGGVIIEGLTASESAEPCTSTMVPNAFGFKDAHGSWEISQLDVQAAEWNTKASFDDLQSSFESVPVDQKVKWLKEHNAKYTIDD